MCMTGRNLRNGVMPFSPVISYQESYQIKTNPVITCIGFHIAMTVLFHGCDPLEAVAIGFTSHAHMQHLRTSL